MIFSDFYKSPRSPLSKLRHHHNQGSAHLPTAAPDWVATEYADLLSKDKAKQKEAVKRYLSDKIRSDWEFQWPPQPHETVAQGEAGQTVRGPGQGEDETQPAPLQVQDETRDDDGYQVDEGSELEQPPSEEDEGGDQEDDAQSVYSVVSEDDVHYRPRVESTSDVTDDDASAASSPGPLHGVEAMRSIIRKRTLDRRARHRRTLRDEMAWNDGLACFEARRNAWTGAKTVRVRSKPPSPALASPRSPRRFFFRHSMSGSPPASIPSTMAQTADAAGAASDASSLAKDNDKELKTQNTQDSAVSDPPLPESYPVETLVPVGQPLLPPNNSLRASITPAVYVSLYDKVVINNLQPACPVNLSDMLRSCIAGWKRDGEWPPRAAVVDSTLTIRRHKKAAATGSEYGGNVARRMSLGLLGREKDDEYRTGKGIRRSLQRALGIGLAPGSPDGGDGERAKEV
ncbi:mitochondrial AAA ATPase [Hirsutella rhossiliensis]|uniref:Mitochondrial AAA ATPase n=1 Tax=Hirsutella rhossiliensis TaxID=111463 RepID=A0A9P8N612_9HYPO|nr:mitochondrial AAA ATPase [Hirsutella rhossiliensis]KAH0968293.1 mitochondrial AAA ATPase [Hirsutella rhossiliensis]